jgi:hypothetical protein
MSINVLNINTSSERNQCDDDHRCANCVVPYMGASVALKVSQQSHGMTVTVCARLHIGPQVDRTCVYRATTTAIDLSRRNQARALDRCAYPHRSGSWRHDQDCNSYPTQNAYPYFLTACPVRARRSLCAAVRSGSHRSTGSLEFENQSVCRMRYGYVARATAEANVSTPHSQATSACPMPLTDRRRMVVA